MLKNKTQFTKKLTKDEIFEIKKLEKNFNQSNEIFFKIDPQSLEYNNESSSHILYYSQGELTGYLLISSFDNVEYELTTIAVDQISFFNMYTVALEKLKENNAEKILFIVDRNDIATSNFIKELGFKLSFSECRMNFDEKKFNPYKKYNIVLKDATPNDLETIAYLDNFSYGNIYNSDDLENSYNTYNIDIKDVKIASLDFEIIGKIKVEFVHGIAGIYGFVVNPKWRGKGIGREILNCVIEDILQSEYKKLYLEVDYNNNIALNLYKSVGFNVQTIFDYYDK